MIIGVPSERVEVRRVGSVEMATVTHHCYQNVLGEDGEMKRGPFLGIGIRTDRGFDLYAQPDQLTKVEVANG